MGRIATFYSIYGEHYKRTLLLATPIVLSQVGQFSVQLFDNAMVGQLGSLPLAAVSFGGTAIFLTFIFAMGLTMGLTPLVGEQFSQGNHRKTASLLQNAVILYPIIGIMVTLLQFAIIPLLYHLGQPEEVVDMAIPYYQYTALSILPFMMFAPFKQFLEGVGKTTVNMMIIITANLINILFNYLLIYGKYGFPEMGAAGAGLATLIARGTMPVFVVIYFYSTERLRRYFKYFSKDVFSVKQIMVLLGVGSPIAAQMLMEGSAFAFTSIMMGWLGTIAIAANQVASVVSNFAFMVVVGISAATTIRVSHEYGRNNPTELRRAANASYHIQLLWNTITAILFITLRHKIPLIFTDDPEVVRIAGHLMLFIAAFQFSDGVQTITVGVLRGIQDVKSAMYVAFFCYLVINLPIAYLCAFTLGMGPGGLWVGIIIGLSLAAILLRRRFNRQFALFADGKPMER